MSTAGRWSGVLAFGLLFGSEKVGASAPTSGTPPVACARFSSATGHVWERAKSPASLRYCDWLASGTAKLVGRAPAANDVIELARRADEAVPGQAAPKILEGRALLILQNPKGAVAAFEEARARDPRALEEPAALLAWARANAQIGARDEAAKAYRALLPSASSLGAEARGSLPFEAAMVLMANGPKDVDMAIAVFRQARRDVASSLQNGTHVGLALALDRAGQKDEAKTLLSEIPPSVDVPSWLGSKVTEALTIAGVPEERDALEATLLEASRRTAARDAWKRYLQGRGGAGPWASHARAHDEQLGGTKSSVRYPREPSR